MKSKITFKDFKNLEPSKKAWHLSMLYFGRCTNIQVFKTGRPSPEFFKVLKFFKKQDELQLDVLYQYLNTIDKQLMTLTQMFNNAQQYNQTLLSKVDANKVAQNYERKDVLSWLAENWFQ